MNDYWLSPKSNKQINPNREDFNPVALLKLMKLGRTLDYGCGWGRLCSAFPPNDYLGFDISIERIESARKLYPKYAFTTHSNSQYFDSILFYTVAVHLTDDEFLAVINKFPSQRVIIIEVLGRQWRREGEPRVYNRELNEYSEMLDEFSLHAQLDLKYAHKTYALSVMDFRTNHKNLFKEKLFNLSGFSEQG